MNDWFDAEAHVDRALELFERGRWAEAEAELRKAIALNPDQPEWHYNLGLTQEAAGRDAEALLSFSRATELLPEEVQPALSAGMAAARLGRHEDAIQWLERVLQLDPRCELAHAHLIDNHVHLGRHEEAKTAFYLAQQALDESGLCFAAIAESLIQCEDYDRAEWCLKEALRISPSLPRVRAMLGRVFAATGRPHRALQMYLRELRDDPGNIDALLDYGALLVENGRLPEAAEKFRRVLELEPAHAEAHMRLGEIAFASGRYEQAHLEFELVLELDRNNSDARIGLAETLMRRNRRTEARAALRIEWERARQLAGVDDDATASDDPAGASDAVDLGRLGKALLDADMVDEAAEVLEMSLQREGENVETLRRLALAHFRAGRSDRGCGASRRVVRLDPNCIEAMYNLALAALGEGRLRFASGWIRRGLSVAPQDEGLRRVRMRLWIAVARRFVNRLFARR